LRKSKEVKLLRDL
jgi:hypothetical protein